MKDKVLQIIAREILPRVVLGFAVLLVLSPLLYMIGISMKTGSEVFANPANPFPVSLNFENYLSAISKLNYWRMLFVSIAYALGVTLGQIFLALPAAYVFAFANFPGRDLLFSIFLGTLTIPFVITYIPNYLLLSQFKLLNSLPGMILPQLANAYGIFLLRQNFHSFPKSVIEAARIDGLNHWSILWKVLVPPHLPVLVALGVYIFVNTWNQYVWPLLVAQTPEMFTLTVGVQSFANGEGGSNWPALMAASTLAILPTLVIFLLVRQQILNTLTEGAVK